MTSYEQIKAKIIATLMGRPAGTEIQPDQQQDYTLNMLYYTRSLELIATSTLMGIAEATTTPVQPDSSKVCYIAGIGQNRTVTFQNFHNQNGTPISITTNDMQGVFVILLWNQEYWSYEAFETNIISHADNANFYYSYNIKKTYSSISEMNADKNNPVGVDGKYIKIGDIVTVVNSTTPTENGIYSYQGVTDGWKFQSSFNFQVEQTRSQNVNTAPSSKLFSDEIVKFQDDLQSVNDSFITGWFGSVTVTDANSNVFGKSKSVKQVVVSPHTGNTMAFNILKNAYSVGDIINVHAIIYTPVDFTIDFSVYTNDSGLSYDWISEKLQKLKIGINYIHAAIKITSANLDATSNLQLCFRNTELAGNTLYINAYWYLGQKKNTLLSDDVFASIENIENNINITERHTFALSEITAGNWTGSADITTEETNIFGKLETVGKIIPTISSGSIFRFHQTNSQINGGNGWEEGSKININVKIYSPVEARIVIQAYTPAGYVTVTDSTTRLKIGINNVFATAILPSSQPYFEFVFSLYNQTGNVFYYKNACMYYGEHLTNPFLATDFYAKEIGKGLIPTSQLTKIENLDLTVIFNNLISFDISKILGNTNLTFENLSPGLRFYSSTTTSYRYINYLINEYWLPNHKYFLAINIKVDTFDINTDGNVSFVINPKYSDAYSIGYFSQQQGLLVGQTGDLKGYLTLNETNSYPPAQRLFIQLNGSWSSGKGVDITINNFCLIDMGEIGSKDEISYEAANSLFEEFGYSYSDQYGVNQAIYAKTAGRATVAETVEQLAVGGDITGYGDSLMAQNWLQYVASATGRAVHVYGYGGKQSPYIRDQYFTNVTPTNRAYTHIFCIGRNNYEDTDVIIDDLRAMIKDLGHPRFIIMMPPNGGYSGEFKTSGSAYSKFTILEERLQREYPNNFVNTRKAVIDGWDCHHITLDGSFIQPTIGNNVQISVSDTSLLTTENSIDASHFSSHSGKIRIGNFYSSDLYSVVSVDSATLMTLQLLEANVIAEGGTVQNGQDTDGHTKYLRVFQDLDYYMWSEDTTLSTYRSDGVHVTTLGQQLKANIIVRALEAMKI